VEKFIYKNAIGEIELSLSRPYILNSVTGVGGLGVSVRKRKSPFQNGSTRKKSYFDDRDIGLTFTALTTSEQDNIKKRREVQKIFSPNIVSELIYKRGTYSKKVICCANSTPVLDNSDKSNQIQKFFVNLTAHDPFWIDLEKTGEMMSFSIASFGFELEVEEEGIELEMEGTNRTILNNEGDVSAPVEIIFKGPASNPKVANETTGEYIQVDQVLEDGEKLIINTEFGNKQVIYDNGYTQVNKFNAISIDSTFWQLEVGENKTTYTVDSGLDVANVVINFRNRYIGL
jgi:hypothetical protein